jgi:hypothetical protein
MNSSDLEFFNRGGQDPEQVTLGAEIVYAF